MSDEELLKIRIPPRINLRLDQNNPEDIKFYLAYQKARHKKEALRDAFLYGNQMVTTAHEVEKPVSVDNYKENDAVEEAGCDFLAALGL